MRGPREPRTPGRPWTPRTGRRRAAVLLGLLGACALVLLGAVPASAHAAVESTFPGQGSQLSTAPGWVSIRFGESIGIDSESIQVLTADGHQVLTGPASHPGGDARTVGVALAPGLAKGSYVVLWHVVSADSHPVSGSFTFGFGVPPGPAPPAPADDLAVVLLDACFRLTALAGTVLLLGGTFFVRLLWPPGLRLARVRRLLVAGWAAAAVSTVALFVAEGPYGSSRSLAGLGDASLLGVTWGTVYGKLLLLRLLALGGAAAVWWGIRRSGRPPGWLDAAGLGLLVVESYSFAGHAGQGSWVPLAATADALHLLAASLWLGGLAVLVVLMLPRLGRAAPGSDLHPAADTPAADSADADATAADLAGGPAPPEVLVSVLPGWSRVAMGAVATLVSTGVYQAWREVGSLDALAFTAYGRLVLAKVAGLVVLLVLGDRGRRWIRRHLRQVTVPAVPEPVTVPTGPPAAGDRAAHELPQARQLPQAQELGAGLDRLRRWVVAEVAVATVVLGLTAVLVNSIPARQSYSPSVETVLTGRNADGGTILVDVAVTPTRAGYQTMTIRTTTPAGVLAAFQSATGSVTEPALGLGPIQFTLTADGTGRATTADVAVPAPGRWRLTLQIRTDPFTDYAASTTYSVT
jgi:copper transport protein